MSSKRENNIEILADTLRCVDSGFYGEKPLKLSRSEAEECRYYSVSEIDGIKKKFACGSSDSASASKISVCNSDSFVCAERMLRQTGTAPAVLNLASGVHPGGGVRKGASAQEEELCRRSSLLVSLESANALRYYEYNRSLHSPLGSDTALVTTKVEVFKDINGRYLEESFVCPVITCSAPNLRNGIHGLTEKRYEELMRGRIETVLAAAKEQGFGSLVLGAFGCGVYHNDARTVARLFKAALENPAYRDSFSEIAFAVLDDTKDKYNYMSFRNIFS